MGTSRDDPQHQNYVPTKTPNKKKRLLRGSGGLPSLGSVFGGNNLDPVIKTNNQKAPDYKPAKITWDWNAPSKSTNNNINANVNTNANTKPSNQSSLMFAPPQISKGPNPNTEDLGNMWTKQSL